MYDGNLWITSKIFIYSLPSIKIFLFEKKRTSFFPKKDILANKKISPFRITYIYIWEKTFIEEDILNRILLSSVVLFRKCSPSVWYLSHFLRGHLCLWVCILGKSCSYDLSYEILSKYSSLLVSMVNRS